MLALTLRTTRAWSGLGQSMTSRMMTSRMSLSRMMTSRLHSTSTTPADSIITPIASTEADALVVPDASVPVKKIPKRFVAFPFEVRTSVYCSIVYCSAL